MKNENLLFEEFTAAIIKKLGDYLSLENTGAELEQFTMRRLNDSYNALQLKREGYNGPLAVLNLDLLYKAYYDGVPWDELVKTAANVLERKPEIDIEKYMDYDYARNRLLIRVCNWDLNKDIASDIPHRRLGDIMLTYYIIHMATEDESVTMRISNEVMDEFGIKPNKLHEDAVKSSMIHMPPVIMTLEEMMEETVSGRSFKEFIPFDKKLNSIDFSKNVNEIYGLTNIHGRGGAAAIFYKNVLSDIAEKAENDLYVIPSSIHEVLILSAAADVDPDNLKIVVASINAEKLMYGVKLADSVFRFSRKEGRLLVI